jgi:hypothetical protein
MSEDTDIVQVRPTGSVSFQKPNDLKKLLKRADKSVEDAFSVIEKIMSDTSLDAKIRLDAAKYLLDKRVELSDTINKDQFARMVADARQELAEMALTKVPRGAKVVPNETDEDGEPTGPIFKPDMIVDVSSIGKVK